MRDPLIGVLVSRKSTPTSAKMCCEGTKMNCDQSKNMFLWALGDNSLIRRPTEPGVCSVRFEIVPKTTLD